MRKRLTEQQARFLGLEIKPATTYGNPKYTITKKQKSKLDEYKRLKGLSFEKDRQHLENVTNTNEYDLPEINNEMSAIGNNGKFMDIDDYCEHYGIDRNNVSTYKLVSHTGTPFYNIAFKDAIQVDDFDYLGELEKQLKDYKPKKNINSSGNGRIGVTTLTDFHFGAYISAMKNTPEFSITILCDMFEESAEIVNGMGYSVVHVHILGDLIESFTGMNHKNSWKGLDKGMFGVAAIKLFVRLFCEHFLTKIDNLGKIKIVAGNHDRTTSDSNEDVDGGVAEMISWGLELLGYDIEFDSISIIHIVDKICYHLYHGHHPYTRKKTTQELCWMNGVKGHYNFITEGHLHSRIQKLSAVQLKNFKQVSDDNIDCRRQVCPSFFTGNSYSEHGGWSTLAGFIISEANHRKKGIHVFDFSF